MTREEMEMTKKYLTDYSDYCSSRECGDGCPVFEEHMLHPQISCFMTYCSLRETGKIK